MTTAISVCNKWFGGRVEVDAAGRIVEAPPVLQRFQGQPFENLVRWLGKQGGPVCVQALPPIGGANDHG